MMTNYALVKDGSVDKAVREASTVTAVQVVTWS